MVNEENYRGWLRQHLRLEELRGDHDVAYEILKLIQKHEAEFMSFDVLDERQVVDWDLFYKARRADGLWHENGDPGS